MGMSGDVTTTKVYATSPKQPELMVRQVGSQQVTSRGFGHRNIFLLLRRVQFVSRLTITTSSAVFFRA